MSYSDSRYFKIYMGNLSQLATIDRTVDFLKFLTKAKKKKWFICLDHPNGTQTIINPDHIVCVEELSAEQARSCENGH